MDTAKKEALKTSGIAGLVTSALVAPIATPAIWGLVAYGTYRLAKAVYRNAKLKELQQGQVIEDQWFF